MVVRVALRRLVRERVVDHDVLCELRALAGVLDLRDLSAVLLTGMFAHEPGNVIAWSGGHVTRQGQVGHQRASADDAPRVQVRNRVDQQVIRANLYLVALILQLPKVCATTYQFVRH